MSNERPDSLTYSAVEQHNGRYRMRQVQLNNTQIANVTLTANGNSLLEWIIPAREVFNPARSNLQYTLTFASEAAKAPFIFDDTFEICNSITVGTAAKPTELMDLQFANNYVSVARKLDTDIEDFESLDYTSGLHASDSVVIGAGAVAVGANYFPPTFDLAVPNTYGVPATTYEEALTLREPQYARTVNALAQGLVVTRIVPLSALTHTFLGMDKDLCFAEDIYIRMMLAGSYKLGYTSTSVSDPSSAPAVFATQPTITLLYLNLAMQSDDEIKAAVLNRLDSGRMKFHIPYQVGWRQSTLAAGQAAININVNRSYGKKLKRFLYIPYISTESTSASLNKAYDHQNMQGVKISVYQTLLASKPLQDQQIVVANMDDFRYNKDLCRRSAIRNSAAYYLNWFHCDSFSNPKRGRDLVPDENIYEGLDLTDANQTWTLNATTAIGLNHHVFAEFIREVHAKPLSQGGLEVIVA